NLTIPNSSNAGPGGIFSSTIMPDPSNLPADTLPFVAIFDPAFSAPAFAAQHFNAGTELDAVTSGTSSTPVGAFILGDLSAAGGNVTINADKISGSGSATAQGTPTITINNESPDYLVLNNITIPDLAGGHVFFTGTAKAGIAFTENNPGTGGTI